MIEKKILPRALLFLKIKRNRENDLFINNSAVVS